MALLQYLKDTRGELRHVAWPTRVQTIIYTILVIAISIIVSLYLGFFDYVFTQALGKIVELLPHAVSTPIEPIISTSTPQFEISTSTFK